MKFLFAIAMLFALNCSSGVIFVFAFDYARKCRYFNESCIIQLGNQLLREDPLGVPNNFIPSLDPILVEKIRIVQDMNAVKVDGQIYNTTMTGLTDATIFQFSLLNDGNIRLMMKVPKCHFDGPYKIEGKLVKLNIKGNGMLTATLENFLWNLTMQVEQIKRDDGKVYLRAKSAGMKMTISNGHCRMSHLSKFTNSLINWSFSVIFAAVSDSLAVPFGKMLVAKINTLLMNVPIDELFLE